MRLARRTLPGLAAALLPLAARAQPAPLTVFAAASLQDALRALDPLWRAASPGDPPLRLSFAASSALARQIEQGAPADLFLSADEPWMDYLSQRGLIVPQTRIAPLGNTLVLVAPTGGVPPLTLERGTDLAPLLGPAGRLSVGDPAHVPAGRYAQAALEWMGAWPALAPRLARAENVRAALLLVERGEAPLGIVYATDALAARGVRVVARFPAESHPPIVYPFALTRRAAGNEAARALLGFLAGPAAAPVWEHHGFLLRGG
jgi:molybdate transport system substrate-binding protein